MKIICVAHQKGGVGKTTLALNLATCFQKGGLAVGILDTDVQGSLAGIGNDLEGIEFVNPDELSNIKNLAYDILMIDTPPYLINTLPELFAISDFVLIPSRVGFFDVMAIRSTLKIISDVSKQKPSLKYGVVMNMVKPRTSINEDIKNILLSYEAKVLKTIIFDRVSYTRSSITNGIFGTEDEKAKDEIMNLADEILRELGF